VAHKEVELDEIDQEILEFVFDEDLQDSLIGEFDPEVVKSLMTKLDIVFHEDEFPPEEE